MSLTGETARPPPALDAFRHQSAVAHRSRAIADLNTSEVRWFAPGRPPHAVMNWFSNGGRAGTREQRRDVYQVNGLSGVGVKRRSGRSLEVKVRTAVGPKLTIAAGLAAPLEDWRKWTPSFTDSVWPQTGASWVVVDKKLLTRTFTMADDEVVGPASHAGANGGCDVELAAVTVDGIEAWTFAFEAFGPRRHRRAEVLSSWERLVADSGAFDGLGVCFERAAGYPGWLRYVVSQPVGTPHRSRTAR